MRECQHRKASSCTVLGDDCPLSDRPIDLLAFLIPTALFSVAASPAASWVKKVGAGSCNFPTDSCKFLTAEIVNFAPKFPKIGIFGPLLYFWTNIF